MSKPRRNNRKPTKFLDASDIQSAINEVAALSRKAGVAVALAGGAAMQLLGSDRLTMDVDFLAEYEDIGLVGEPKRLSFGGIGARTRNSVPVDLIVRDDKYKALYDAALENAEEYEDVAVRVVTAEYMVAIKFSAARDKDIQDLAFLLLDVDDLDYAAAQTIVEEYLGVYALDELERYREEFEWVRSKTK